MNKATIPHTAAPMIESGNVEAPANDLDRSTHTANAMLTAGRSLILPESLFDADEGGPGPSDAAIAGFGAEYNLLGRALVERLRLFVDARGGTAADAV